MIETAGTLSFICSVMINGYARIKLADISCVRRGIVYRLILQEGVDERDDYFGQVCVRGGIATTVSIY